MNHSEDFYQLVHKYNVQGPRYTSYPTVPFWDEKNFTQQQYLQTLKKTFQETNTTQGISIYIHLPFCESLCTFCGCNKRITKNHGVEEPYIELLKKEWDLYLALFSEKPMIKEIHLGGGTPTFFSPKNLENLIQHIFRTSKLYDEPELGFEAHPNNTTQEHLQVLYDLGFRRISMGVQDYNPVVQEAIHRIQPFEKVKKLTEISREMGYTSISHDLVFGLPKQKVEGIRNTVLKTIELNPDRLAFYSYAHVPWIDGIIGQRGFSEEDIPTGYEKRILYETGRKLFEEAGYIEIGMDHFAKPHDSLYQAVLNKTLHRNFMGYTIGFSKLMIGLGVSSIGDTWLGFGQNLKTLEQYEEKIHRQELPIFRGHLLSEKDLIIRQHILNIMCRWETHWDKPETYFPEIPQVLQQLKEAENDGLLEIYDNYLKITELGKAFVRNISMAFDLHLKEKQPQTKIFSMTI